MCDRCGDVLLPEAAVAEAQSFLVTLGSTPAPAVPAGPAAAVGLSPREVEVLRLVADGRSDREIAEALFIGGGNTFRLLKSLYDFDLIVPIRRRVFAGMPFIGSSAGSNVSCPTIRTTKDMPIVEPPSLDALGLVPFQISPHYLDPDPGSTHMGETQEQRILQFLEESATPVVGLREGSMLRVEEGSIHLGGVTGARIFRRGREPVEALPGTTLDDVFVRYAGTLIEFGGGYRDVSRTRRTARRLG